MKRLMTFAVIILFLMSSVGFAVAKNSFGITASAINNNSEDGNQNQVGADDDNETDLEDIDEETEEEVQNKIRERINGKLTDEQIQKIFTHRNRIKNRYANQSDCPENCTCTGSVVKCMLPDGTREMTVTAGKSGNVIIQIKGVNVSTNVTLYKANGKIYAVNKNNETKRIKLLPDQVRERIRERLARQLENENITLNEDGTYNYQAVKKAKLFFLIPVKVKVMGELNSETGKIIKVRNSWWAFLAKDDESEEIVGASCGTVTPGYNNECCKNKGYDLWDSETSECEFNEED